MPTLHYFAYGSNMLASWLQRRCSTASAQGAAFADDWALNFAKKSKLDGSGKATIFEEPGNRLFGVVFDLEENQRVDLDRAEGTGYRLRHDFMVRMVASEELVSTITYIADLACTHEGLKPYDWYLNLILAGAQQHGLPAHYINSLKATPVVVDQIADRQSRLTALALLGNTKGC